MYYRDPVFILYAIVAGLAIGRLLDGRFDNLGTLSFRWTWVAIAGLAAQVVLFSGPVSAAVGDAGAPLYVASTVAVLGFVLRNVRIPGMSVVALGAGLNLVAIAANGGTMPASGTALASLGGGTSGGYINSRELVAPVLLPLGDVFALPSWMPFANVFSVGDVLIGAGIFVVIVAAMRRGLAEGAAVVTSGPAMVPEATMDPGATVTGEPSIVHGPAMVPEATMDPAATVTGEPSIVHGPAMVPEATMAPGATVTGEPSIVHGPAMVPPPTTTPGPADGDLAGPEPRPAPPVEAEPQPSVVRPARTEGPGTTG